MTQSRQPHAALALFQQIESRGSLVLQGYSWLHRLREAIQLAVQQAGYGISFDPTSAPDLIDYLTVAGTTGLDGALKGAFFGMLVGTLFDEPKLGAAVGAALGGGVGVSQGVQAVEQGWRIRAIRTADDSPHITIENIRAA